MDKIIDFIVSNGFELLYVIITAIISYITIKFKKIYTNYINDDTKKHIAEICVNACEQLYKDHSSEEKYEYAVENLKLLLKEKNITLSDLEIQMLIENFCNSISKDKND